MKKLCILIMLLFSSSLYAHGLCHKARIISPGIFNGNHDELVELFDGSVWVVKYSYENMGLEYPMARICPKKNLMIVKGVKFYVTQNF